MSLLRNTSTSINFPYITAHVDGHTFYYPRIVVTLDVFLGKQPYDFILDTGADITTLPSYMISMLGLDKSTLTQSLSHGIHEKPTLSWNGTLPLTIKNYTFEIPCLFVENTKIPLLLGKEGVFEKFNIFLDNENHQTILTWLKS